MGEGEKVQGEDVRHGGKEGGSHGEWEEGKLGKESQEMNRQEAAKVAGKNATNIKAEPAKCEVRRGGKGGKGGEEVQGEELNHGGKGGEQEGEEEGRKKVG